MWGAGASGGGVWARCLLHMWSVGFRLNAGKWTAHEAGIAHAVGGWLGEACKKELDMSGIEPDPSRRRSGC